MTYHSSIEYVQRCKSQNVCLKSVLYVNARCHTTEATENPTGTTMEGLRFSWTFFAIVLCIYVVKSAHVETHTKKRLDDATKEKIDKFIETIMECRGNTGVTLAVVSGEETYTQGYGIRDIDTQDKVDTDTRYDIGSVTKHFGATLLGILLDEHPG